MKPYRTGSSSKQSRDAVECLHYAMSLPTSVVITGIDNMDVLKQDLEAVRSLTASKEENSALLKRTEIASCRGPI